MLHRPAPACVVTTLNRPLLAALLLLGAPLALPAQAPATPAAPPAAAPARAAVRVSVTADHADWNYALGEPVKFTVSVTGADQAPLAGAIVTYSIGPEMLPAEKKTATLTASGTLVVDGGTMKEPGFLRCVATCEHGGRTHRGLATAGFVVDQIRPTQTEPVDFDAYWSKAKADLARLPIDARLTPLPDEGNAQVEVFQISLQNVGGAASAPPSRFYGILCVPRGPGPFPAMMTPPGAGIRRIGGDREMAARGFITLQVGIHGVPVTLPPELYSSLGGALGGYPTLNLDDRDRYYFRRVFLGCLRANDYLVTHPKWDGKTLVGLGGSQGGFLTIVTAALDPRVSAVVVSFPAYCDVTGYVHGRAGGWPRIRFDDPAEPGRDAKIATTAYFDAVNFARRLKVPGHYGWGYNDETCPPTSMFSAYNVITAPKTLAIFKEMGHPRVPELTAVQHAWLFRQVGLAAPEKARP